MRSVTLPAATLALGIILGAHDSIYVERLLRALASTYTLHGAAVVLGVAAVRYWRLRDELLFREYDQGRKDGYKAGLADGSEDVE